MVSFVANASWGKRVPAILLALSLFCSAFWTFALYSGVVDAAAKSGPVAVNSATSAAALIACAGVYRALGSRAERAPLQPFHIGIATCGLALSCATGAMLVACPNASSATAILRMGAITLMTVLDVVQFREFAKLERASMVRASASAFVAAAVAAVFLRPSSFAADALISLLPLAGSVALAAAHAILAKRPCPKTEGDTDAMSDARASATVAEHEPNVPKHSGFIKPSRAACGLCATMLILGFAHDNARIGYLSSIPSGTDAPPLMGLAVYALVVTLMVVASAWLQLQNSTRHMATCYHMAVLALVASQLLPLLPFEPSTHSAVILPVHMGVYRGMLFFLWVVTLQAANADRTLLYCVSQAAVSLGSLVGITAWDAAHAAMVGDTFFYPLMLLSTLGLLAAYVVFFTDEDLKVLIMPARKSGKNDAMSNSDRDGAEEGGNRRFTARCDAAAKRFGLTPRETEIMIMFAKGRNLDYIHNELVISKSTVSMHRQHIYRKLGVHSQQEMIDLIERQDVIG